MIFKERLNRTTFRLLCGVLAVSLGILMLVLSRPSDDPIKAERLRSKTDGTMLSIKELVAGWRLENGPLPKGLDNHGLLDVLTKGDMKHVVDKSFEDGKISWRGEIVDGWGTPFRISTDDGTKVHIISAGPDKIFGTPDDITNQ